MVLVPALVYRSPLDVARRRERRGPMLAVLALAAPTLVAWFLLAPDPRFALAPLLSWCPDRTGRVGAPRCRRRRRGRTGAGLEIDRRRGRRGPARARDRRLARNHRASSRPSCCWRSGRGRWVRRRPASGRRASAGPRFPNLATQSLAGVVVAYAGFVAYAGGFEPDRSPTATDLWERRPCRHRAVEYVRHRSGLRLSRPAGREDRCYPAWACSATPGPTRRIPASAATR